MSNLKYTTEMWAPIHKFKQTSTHKKRENSATFQAVLNRTSLNIHTQIRITRTVVSRRDEEFVCRRKGILPINLTHQGFPPRDQGQEDRLSDAGGKGLFAQTIYSLSGPVKVKVFF